MPARPVPPCGTWFPPGRNRAISAMALPTRRRTSPKQERSCRRTSRQGAILDAAIIRRPLKRHAYDSYAISWRQRQFDGDPRLRAGDEVVQTPNTALPSNVPYV